MRAWLQGGGTARSRRVPSRAGEDVARIVCWTSAAPAAVTQGEPYLCRIFLLFSLGLVRCSLYWGALSFQLWERGWGISPPLHQCGQCLLELLWVPFQVTGDQQRGTTAAGGGNLLIRYPPCFLPVEKHFDRLAQAPVPDTGSS